MARGFSFKPVGLSDFAQLTANRQAFEKDRNQSIKNAINGIGRGIIENNINKKYADNPMGIAAMKERAVRYAPIDPAEAKIYADLVNKAEKLASDKAAKKQKALEKANERNFSAPINAQVLNPETNEFSTQSVVLDKNNNVYYFAGDEGGQPIPSNLVQAVTGKGSAEYPPPREIKPALQIEARKTIEQIKDFPGSWSGFSGKTKKNLTRQLIEYAATKEARDKGDGVPPQSFTNYILEGYDLLKDDPKVFKDRKLSKFKLLPDYDVQEANRVLTDALGPKQDKQAMPSNDNVINDIKIIQFLENKTDDELVEIYDKGDDNIRRIVKEVANKRSDSN